MHAAVTGEKIAAETLGDAVSLVLAHELTRVKLKKHLIKFLHPTFDVTRVTTLTNNCNVTSHIDTKSATERRYFVHLVLTIFGTFRLKSYLEHGEGMAGVCVDLTIEVTLDTVQVQHPGVAGGSLVDAEEPLHVAVTQPGVAAQ